MEALLYIIQSRTPFFYRYDNFFLLFYHFSFFHAFSLPKAGEDALFLSSPASVCHHHYAFHPRRYILASLYSMLLPQEKRVETLNSILSYW